MSITEQVKGKLSEGGSIGSADVAEFIKPSEPQEDIGKASEETSTVTVPKEANEDPMLNLGAVHSVSDDLDESAMLDNMEHEDYAFGQLSVQEIKVTPEQKDKFIDAIVQDQRYEEEFSIFGGRLTGVFRSRRTDESRSILKELHRRWAETGSMPASEYSTMMRHALLRCQLKEFKGVEYPEMKHPLAAQVKAVEGEPRSKIVPPKWYAEMDQFFSGMGDGLLAAIYKELMLFERRYWTMTKHADDQNFWGPEDSTLP